MKELQAAEEKEEAGKKEAKPAEVKAARAA